LAAAAYDNRHLFRREERGGRVIYLEYIFVNLAAPLVIAACLLKGEDEIVHGCANFRLSCNLTCRYDETDSPQLFLISPIFQPVNFA